jgi:indole-3-glycerol phosphate synthase
MHDEGAGIRTGRPDLYHRPAVAACAPDGCPDVHGERALRTYLDELLAGAHRRVAHARSREPLPVLRERARRVPAPPSLYDALVGDDVAVIAEVKRASPSKGPLAIDLDAAAQARAYLDGGAAAISVLTEPERFRGTLEDLAAVAALGRATLRKDFVVDPYQIWEARSAGASAVLLIVAALDATTLRTLHDEAHAAGLGVLVEVHDEAEVELARQAGARIVGVNARDLRTFELDRDAFARLRPMLPEGCLAVAESGIRGPADVQQAAEDGADAVLVGESLVTASNPQAAVTALVEAGSRGAPRSDPGASLQAPTRS